MKNTQFCELFRNLPKNFVLCYGDFNISNRPGMRSTKVIHLIIDRNLSFILLHCPAKFHQNHLGTF